MAVAAASPQAVEARLREARKGRRSASRRAPSSATGLDPARLRCRRLVCSLSATLHSRWSEDQGMWTCCKLRASRRAKTSRQPSSSPVEKSASRTRANDRSAGRKCKRNASPGTETFSIRSSSSDGDSGAVSPRANDSTDAECHPMQRERRCGSRRARSASASGRDASRKRTHCAWTALRNRGVSATAHSAVHASSVLDKVQEQRGLLIGQEADLNGDAPDPPVCARLPPPVDGAGGHKAADKGGVELCDAEQGCGGEIGRSHGRESERTPHQLPCQQCIPGGAREGASRLEWLPRGGAITTPQMEDSAQQRRPVSPRTRHTHVLIRGTPLLRRIFVSQPRHTALFPPHSDLRWPPPPSRGPLLDLERSNPASTRLLCAPSYPRSGMIRRSRARSSSLAGFRRCAVRARDPRPKPGRGRIDAQIDARLPC